MPKSSVGESFTVAIISATEKVRMREKGVSRISIEDFLSHSPENFLSGEPLSVSLTSGIKKFYASEAYVTIFDFLSKFFCPTVPNSFVSEPFSVSSISGIKKVWIEWGEHQYFPSNTFCLTVPKLFVGEHSTIHFFRVSKNFMLQRVMSLLSIFCRFFLSHSAEKFRRWTLLCFVSQKLRLRKILWIRGGGVGSIKIFRRKVFVSQCRKIP